jgi:putative ABC transport system permease protein
MLDFELVKRSFHTIKSFGVKSILTILGIIVAVTAIVALIAIGNGFQDSINSQFQALGTNTIIITPGRTIMEAPFSSLNENDAELIAKVAYVDVATAMRMASVQIDYKNSQKYGSITGISLENLDLLNKIGIIVPSEGSLPHSSGKIIVGYKFATQKFDDELRVGNRIKIGDELFEVVGIMGKQRNFMTAQFSNSIVMLESDFKKISSAPPSRIFVQFNEVADLEEVKEDIIKKLKNAHGEEDFQLMDSKQLIESSLSIMGTIQIIVVGIAAIALIVGAIGVMNMMFMSVSNRIREIGIMKAIGATNQQVMMIFLMEAMLIGMIGGIIGAALGGGVAILAEIVATELEFTLNSAVTIELVLFAIFFAGGIGIVSGVLPALYASNLDPVDAIRK